MDKNSKESCKNEIIGMLERIDDINVLSKIYTVVKTQLRILEEKKGKLKE